MDLDLKGFGIRPAERDLVRELTEALLDLYAEVERGESVGVCLPDRVPSLRAGQLLAELGVNTTEGAR